MTDKLPKSERIEFMKMAFLFQGSLLIVALIVGWGVKISVWDRIAFSAQSIGFGILATIPMLLFLAFAYRSNSKSLVQIRQLLREILGKSLATCRWYDLCALALLAGVSEEVLFRGTLEPWLSRYGSIFGLVVCNLLFGLCHAITPIYALLATLMGVYLSLTLWFTNGQDLTVPILCHSLYDLVAFVVVIRSVQLNETQNSPKAETVNKQQRNPN